MGLTKTTILVVIAATSAMAFLGASSATAAPEHPEIVLCKNAELICETPYPSPTEIHLETLPANPPKLLSSIGTVECEYALGLVTLLNKLAKLIEAHLLGLILSGNCHLGSTACTATVNAVGAFSVTPGEKKLTAIIKPIPLEGRETNTTYKCGSFINCTYGAKGEMELISDAEGHLSLEAEVTMFEGKGFLCPKTSVLDALLDAVALDEGLTRLTHLYIEL